MSWLYKRSENVEEKRHGLSYNFSYAMKTGRIEECLRGGLSSVWISLPVEELSEGRWCVLDGGKGIDRNHFLIVLNSSERISLNCEFKLCV